MITVILIVALLIAIIAVVFALQNTAAVTVSFIIWELDQSLALVLLVTVLVGVLIGLLSMLPGTIRNKWRLSSNRKKLDNLEKMLQEEKIKREDVERRLLELQTASAASPSVNTQPPPDLQQESAGNTPR